jgi:hypothetical protein
MPDCSTPLSTSSIDLLLCVRSGVSTVMLVDDEVRDVDTLGTSSPSKNQNDASVPTSASPSLASADVAASIGNATLSR